ncbi:MAG: enoyl-CoA hydratase-related protein, partial [Myxococcaceae bacterium]
MATPAKNFSYRVDCAVAIITMDMPGEPVNTLSPEVGPEFEALLKSAGDDPAVKAVVFTSSKKDCFVAGAKIEFVSTLKSAAEAAEASRKGQESFDRLDAFPKPVVAAINGACLGGGLEWALACDYRLASDNPKTSLGLPETQLGLIPGAGGTQRLPALIGAQAALDLILTGKTLKAKKAQKLGVVDEVVPAAILLEVAKRRAGELAAGELKPVRVRGIPKAAVAGKGLADILRGLADRQAWAEFALEDNPLGRKVLFDQARKQLLKKTRGKYPAQEKVLEVIRVGLDRGMKAGLEAEARAFGELVVSDVSKQLIHIFHATTAMKKENGTNNPEVKAHPVKKVGVLGGGLMGGGI